MHVASQLETAPLQLPRPRRLIGKLLVLLGRLPLSDFHPDAPVGLDVVAALVSRFMYVYINLYVYHLCIYIYMCACEYMHIYICIYV